MTRFGEKLRIGKLHSKVTGKERHTSKWEKKFNLPEGEQLLADFSCKMGSARNVISGHCYISTHHFCFYGLVFLTGTSVTLVTPLSKIRRIGQAATIVHQPTSQAHRVPAVAKLEGHACDAVCTEAHPSVIQLFTTDNLIQQFTGFGMHYDAALEALTSAWKTEHDLHHESTSPIQMRYEEEPRATPQRTMSMVDDRDAQYNYSNQRASLDESGLQQTYSMGMPSQNL